MTYNHYGKDIVLAPGLEESYGFSLELRGATYEFKCYVSRVERGKPFSRHALMFFADNRLLGAGRAIENKIGKPAFLKDADIGPTFEQMGRKTVAQRMQRHRLLDAGRVSRLVKQTIELPGRHRPSGLAAREQPALLLRHACIVTSRSHLPPLPQQIERLWRQRNEIATSYFDSDSAGDVMVMELFVEACAMEEHQL